MADYNSSYTGQQIDDAIELVRAADPSPIQNSERMITSGAVYDAIQTSYAQLFSTSTSIPSDGTTITCNDNLSRFRILYLVLNTSSSSTSGSMIISFNYVLLQFSPVFSVAGTNGVLHYIRLNRVQNQGTQFTVISHDFSTLYLKYVYGIL